MDLETIKAQYSAHWARTGAIILFLVAAMLLAASLTTTRNAQSADAALKPGPHVSNLTLTAFTPAS